MPVLEPLPRRATTVAAAALLVTAVAWTVLATTALPASAAAATRRPLTRTVRSDGGSRVVVARPGAAVKSALRSTIEARSTLAFSRPGRAAATPAVGLGIGSTNLYESVTEQITPPRGKRDGATTYFYTTLDGYWSGGDVVAEFDGMSAAAWYGTDPSNCRDIALTDHWWVNGWFVSFSYPAGLGITGGGETGSWTTSFANEWLVTHYFDNVDFSSSWDIFSADENSQFQMTFGTSSWQDTTPTA